MTEGEPKLSGCAESEEPLLPARQPDGSITEGGALNAATPQSSAGEQKLFYVVLLVLVVAALYLAYIVYQPFLTSLFLAVVLTIAFLPVHSWVSQRVRSRSFAALITTTLVVLVVLVPLIYLSIRLSTEATSLYGFVMGQWGGNWSNHSAWLSEAIGRVAEKTGIPAAQIQSTITSRVQGFGAWVLGMFGWAARGFAQQLTTALLTFLALFFFLRDREEFLGGIVGILPLPRHCVQQLAAAMHETVIANVYGACAVGLIQGALTALGFWVLGMRAPLFWGAIATIFSFVPLVGPSLVWLPGGIALGLQGSWGKAFALFLWGAVVISSVDYIVRPRIAAGRVNANTLLVLLSLLGGLKAFGAVGIIAGPVVLSVVSALLKMIREQRPMFFGKRELAGSS
jgi:predicted PurR-regulated permease PerM